MAFFSRCCIYPLCFQLLYACYIDPFFVIIAFQQYCIISGIASDFSRREFRTKKKPTILAEYHVTHTHKPLPIFIKDSVCMYTIMVGKVTLFSATNYTINDYFLHIRIYPISIVLMATMEKSCGLNSIQFGISLKWHRVYHVFQHRTNSGACVVYFLYMRPKADGIVVIRSTRQQQHSLKSSNGTYK